MADRIERETELDAEPDEVWRAMTEQGDPDGWLGEIERLDLEPGGELEIGDRRGWVEHAEEGRRLTFWWSRPEETATRVELELEPTEDGTAVSVTETRPLHGLEVELAGISRPGPLALAT